MVPGVLGEVMDKSALKGFFATLGNVERHWWLMVVCTALLSGIALSRGWSWRTGVSVFVFVSTCYLALRSGREQRDSAGTGKDDTTVGDGSDRTE